jgi:acyl-CoA hydrolase
MQRVRLQELDLRSYLRSGDGVVISQGTAEPRTLTETLLSQSDSVRELSIFLGGGSFSGTFTPERTGGHRFVGYGGVGDHRRLIQCGAMDIIPVHVSSLPNLIGREVRCDVAMIQVSGPRADGSFSYSLSADYTAEAVTKARVVFAESNRNAPETYCDATLDATQIDVLIETERDLIQMPSAPVTSLDCAIAANIAQFIGDRSTLQIGYGAIPEAIIATLGDRKDLGLHTGVIGDSVVGLIERGIISNAYKEVAAGVSVTGALWGSDRLYDFVDRNPLVRLCGIKQTHAPEVLGQLTRLVTINSAIEVDLTGQVNAEQVGSEYIGAIGGQVDFVRAGARASAGASIIALASTARGGAVSKIVARLAGPVTTARSDVDIIATEHGAARLKGCSLRTRVERMIGLADERFREELARAALTLYGVRASVA